MVVTFEPATSEHVREFAPLVRKEDVRECEALQYPDAATALEASLAASYEAATVRFDGEIAAMYGLVEIEPQPGAEGASCVWLLTGRAVDRFPMSFFRLGRPVLAQLLSRAALLTNAIPVQYRSAVRWVKSLGFTVCDPRPIGPKGDLFHVVAIRR